MRILKQGREQKGWSIETACTGNGNGGGGCGALLLVEEADLFLTFRHDMDGETTTYVTFRCIGCSVPTDIPSVPSRVREAVRQRIEVLCVRPDQRVTTRRGYVPIDQILVGDEVLTHKGRFRKVTEVLSRDYKGHLVGLRAVGSANQKTWVTPEHPIYGMNRDCFRGTRLGDRSTEASWKPNAPIPLGTELDWVSAGSIRGGDVGFVPKMSAGEKDITLHVSTDGSVEMQDGTIAATGRWEGVPAPRAVYLPKSVPVDERLAEVLGMFLAEGHIAGNHFAFSFHTNETDFHALVKSVMSEKFGLSCYENIVQEKNSIQLVYTSKLLAQTFSQFGANSFERCFPEEWLDASPHIIAAALRGLFKGDGSFSPANVRLATKSVSLAYRTKDFLRMLGIACSIHTEDNGAMRVLVQDEDAFYQKVMGYDYDAQPVTRKPLRLTPEGSWATFRTSQTESYQGKVYNLEVEEDHSYTVEGLAIHNCWKIGESFVKQQNHKDDVYGKLYVARKAIEMTHNAAGGFKTQAEASLAAKKFGKDTQAFKHYTDGKLPPARIQLRAQRRAVKIFLSHWHAVAFFLANGRLGPQPYSIDHLKHAHVIPIPNTEMVPGLVDALKAAGRTA